MFDVLVFGLGLVVLVFFSFFLYCGGTIFDLLTLASFNYIFNTVDKNIEIALDASNKIKEYNIAPNTFYIYKTTEDVVTFFPLLNTVSIELHDKTTLSFDIHKDVAVLVPVFALLNREFNYESLKL